MFLKENIDKKNCLIEQMTSATCVMVYIASLRGYQVRRNKILYSKEIFLMLVILMINLFPECKIVILMINLFPKHKFVCRYMFILHKKQFFCLGNATFFHYSLDFYPDFDLHCFKIGIFPSPC